MSGGEFISVCTKCGQRRYSYTPRILSACGMIREGSKCNGIYTLVEEYQDSAGQTKLRDWS